MVGGPCLEPIRPLTEFTHDELMELEGWMGRLKDMLMEKLEARKRAAGHGGSCDADVIGE